jgi:hypothetical protein
MNDLQQIDQENAKAIANNAAGLRQSGAFIVVEKAGLHVIGAESFTGFGAELRAQARLAELNTSGNSTHGVLLPPTGA